jgi:hypothetical protein
MIATKRLSQTHLHCNKRYAIGGRKSGKGVDVCEGGRKNGFHIELSVVRLGTRTQVVNLSVGVYNTVAI